MASKRTSAYSNNFPGGEDKWEIDSADRGNIPGRLVSQDALAFSKCSVIVKNLGGLTPGGTITIRQGPGQFGTDHLPFTVPVTITVPAVGSTAGAFDIALTSRYLSADMSAVVFAVDGFSEVYIVGKVGG